MAAALIIVFASVLVIDVHPTPTRAEGGTLLILGDSLTWGTAYPGFGNVTPQLKALGTFDRVVIDGVFARNISGPAGTRRNAVKTYKKLLKDGLRPSAVIIALGSNDIQHSAKPAFYEALTRELLEVIGDIPVVWINILRSDQPYYPRRSAVFNKTLVRVTTKYPNLSIVDWASMVAQNPEWFAFDKLHLTPVGYRARAAVYVQAAEAMWVALTPTTTTTTTTTVPATTTIPETTTIPATTVAVTTTVVG